MVAPSRNGIKSDRGLDAAGATTPVRTAPARRCGCRSARGSSAARRSSGGAVAIRRASPSRSILASATAHGRCASDEAVAMPDTVRAAAAGRRGVTRRPDDGLGSVVGISLGREHAADDAAVAGRPDHQVPVVRARDQVDGEARVRRGQERVDARGLRVAAGDRERQVRAGHAVEEPLMERRGTGRAPRGPSRSRSRPARGPRRAGSRHRPGRG